MKRILTILVLALFVGGGAAFAQSTVDFTSLKGDFQQFATDVSGSLPFASTMGLNWSSAYFGNLPHLGVGLAAGVATAPTTGFVNALKDLGMTDLATTLSDPQYKNLGVPLPTAVLEGRIGGLFVPFDIGVKVGFIPQEVNLSAILPAGMNIQYHMYGVDLKIPVTKEGFLLIPLITVGVGVTHYDGGISADTGVGTISLSNFTDPAGNTYALSLSSPQVNFNWNTNDVDFNIELSKTILWLVTPYIGAGFTIGRSEAGGGLSSQLMLNGSAITQSEIDSINNEFTSYGYPAPITSDGAGFQVQSPTTSYSARVFGGVSLNVLFIKADVTAMYDIMTQKVGLTLGTRLQF